jgi:hypothetical protein
MERELLLGKSALQPSHKLAPKDAAQNPYREKEARWRSDRPFPIRGQAAARHDTVNVRVLAPTPTIPKVQIIRMFRSSTPFIRFMALL